ncbi:hypothetical protein ACRB80_01260 [Thermoanaerobacter mathranii]
MELFSLEYAQFLQQRVYKEDNILYMMPDVHLPEKQQKELLEKFEEVKNW